MVECNYIENCITGKIISGKCMKCKNNKKRNYVEDHFIEATDEPIPVKHIYARPYDGPAEQTNGYKCPICHEHTNPYTMQEKLCKHCGYRILL